MKKHWKIILTVTGILILAVSGGAWYLNMHWKRVLDKELRRYVMESSDSLYTLTYGAIDLNLLTGSLVIHQVALHPDSVVYQRLVQEQRAPALLYNARTSRLQVTRMRLWRYFLNNEVNAGGFALVDPEITVVEDQRSIDTSKPESFYEAVHKDIRRFNIDRLILAPLKLDFTQIRKDGSRAVVRLDQLDIDIRHLEIDSLSQHDPSRFLYARTFDINLDRWSCRTPDSLYELRMKDICLHAADQAVNIGEARLDPRFSREEFDRTVGAQQDRFEISFRNLRLDGISPQNLLQQQVIVRNVNIDAGELHIYRNRSLPMPPGDKLGQFPNQLLMKLKTPLRIDTLFANSVDVSYTEVSAHGRGMGKVQFQHAGGLLRNITNIDSAVAANPHCIADLHAVLMQTGKLKVRFDLMLGDPAGAFNVSGQLNNMDGREFNALTKPLGQVEIRSVRIQDLEFNISGDERKASGTLKLLYSKLKIAVLRERKDASGNERKGLVSLIANLLAIRNANPMPGEAPRTVKPLHHRNPRKSFFNLIWKTIFTGVKETVGTSMLTKLEKKETGAADSISLKK